MGYVIVNKNYDCTSASGGKLISRFIKSSVHNKQQCTSRR